MASSTNNIYQPITARKSGALHGAVTVAGDKSISHRALILASQALGTTTIHGLLEGEDVLRTADALRKCGVSIEKDSTVWRVSGVGIGGLSAPSDILDMGNAGTGVRLMMGLLAPYPFQAQFTGDDSLKKRPMQRVMLPLEKMGARFIASDGNRLPLAMQGAATPMPVHYTLPVASAQIKSAILLAGLNTPGLTTVIEPEATRDHTERMLRYFGVPVTVTHAEETGTIIALEGQPNQSFADREFHVPADPSSAAFLIVAALLVPGSEMTVKNVCLNPLRTGLFQTLEEMGGDISYHNVRDVGGETIGDITARHSQLTGTEVPALRAPSMIDEYPILAMAAACAHGRSVMHNVAELRVKESNRLSAIIEGLHACGVDAREEGDTLVVHGRGHPPMGASSTIVTHYDHRIAMSFLILGLVTENAITVDDTRAIATSFPNFVSLMRQCGAIFELPQNADDDKKIAMLIAVDGPAASGKGTLARRLADYYDLTYLDTGSLYRAVGMRLIYANKSPDDVAAAIAAARSIQDHDLANPKLRSERIGQAASIVSAIPEVREALLDYQRNFAARKGGAVLDGRDIGTVICPNADFKFFINASLEMRATRRHKQLNEYGVKVDYDSVKADLEARDARDAARSVAPLKPANDALQIDTSGLSANQVFERVLRIIQEQLAAA
jgi:3-phosphoshikimate 1-carboxyvinyltransferase